MPDPVQALLDAGAVPATTFPPTSRYAGVPIASYDAGDGTPPTPFLSRRFCPQPEAFADLTEHTVVQGERPDGIAATELGEPELWWRLADANRATDPRELVDPPGRRLRVTLPAGVPGAPGV
jgi:hypothetical protein